MCAKFYTKEEQELALNEFERLGSVKAVIHILCYSSRAALYQWYERKKVGCLNNHGTMEYDNNQNYDKYKNKEICTTPHFYEEELKEIAFNAINELIKDKDSIIENCNLVINQVLQTEDLKAKEEVDKISELINQLLATNVTTIQNQADYEGKYKKLSSRYSSALNDLKRLKATIQDKTLRKIQINQFLKL